MLECEPRRRLCRRRLCSGGLFGSKARIKPTGQTGECWRVSSPSAAQSVSPVRNDEDKHQPAANSIAPIDKLWIEPVADVTMHAEVCVHDLEVSPSCAGLAETPQVVVGYVSILEVWVLVKQFVKFAGALAPSPLDGAAEVVVHDVVAYSIVRAEVASWAEVVRWACGRKGRIRHELIAGISATSGTLGPTGVAFARWRSLPI